MKGLLLLLVLPCLVVADEVCPGGSLICPEGKRCCEENGQPSCCSRGKRSVLNGDEPVKGECGTINGTVSVVQHASAWGCDLSNCPGTCCSGGCCYMFRGATCCPNNICCPSGSTCCGSGCCPPGHICSGGNCCPIGSRNCGSWCCQNNWRCGKRFLTCGGSRLSLPPFAFSALAVVAAAVISSKAFFV